MAADFSFLTTRLSTGGGVASPADARELAEAGITAVVDCRAELDDAPLLVAYPQVLYLWCPTQDDGSSKPPEWFGRGIAFALAALALPRARVHAHCAAGINRGPSMAFAIMLALGWAAEAAEAQIRAARPQVGLRYRDDAIAGVKKLGYA